MTDYLSAREAGLRDLQKMNDRTHTDLVYRPAGKTRQPHELDPDDGTCLTCARALHKLNRPVPVQTKGVTDDQPTI